MQRPDAEKKLTLCRERYPALNVLGVRAAFLFINFLLIIMALYQLKPASRSLFIETLGAEQLPYVWIGTAVAMGVLISGYHRLVERISRIRVVLGSCLFFLVALVLFRFLSVLSQPSATVAFYIFVDILGVVLVEQFWSLTNSIFSSREGRGWYGFIGAGGLVGGVLGGGGAAFLLTSTPLVTADLLLVAAGILGALLALNWTMARMGMYCEVEGQGHPTEYRGGWKALRQSRYLMMIAGILLLSQLATPIVEYQFLRTVEGAFPVLEERTAYLSTFFSVLGMVSIGVCLVITPLVHRFFGVVAGLLVQPLVLGLSSLVFFLQPTLLSGALAKIADRGLSYSINRASRELLYVPIDSVLIYQAKAWIDMFGYRLFKIFGSLVILLFTRWLPFTVSVPFLSWFTLVICLAWAALVFWIGREYRHLGAVPGLHDRETGGMRGRLRCQPVFVDTSPDPALRFRKKGE